MGQSPEPLPPSGPPRSGHLKKTTETQMPLQGVPSPRVLAGDPELSRLLRSALLPRKRRGWQEEAPSAWRTRINNKGNNAACHFFFPNKIMWDSQ